MAASFLDLLRKHGVEGPLQRQESGSAAQAQRPTHAAGSTRAWDFAFATGIECSNPLIVDEQGKPLRRDLLGECGHYERWREDLALVKDLGIPVLRYGLPNHLVHLGPDRYDWSFADQAMAEI